MTKDYNEAIKWYRKGAELGSKKAEEKLNQTEKTKKESANSKTPSQKVSPYSPAGIKYRQYGDGVTISIYFNPHNNWGRIELEYGADYGYQRYNVSFSWTCNGNTVKINPESMLFPVTTFTISKDRNTLSENTKGKISKYYRVN